MLRRLLLLLALAVMAPAAATGELIENEAFDRYSPLAAADEFSRRVFSPTTYDRLLRYEQHIGLRPMEQTVELSRERYDIWVPETRPERGYGMRLVYSTGGNDTSNGVLDARGRQEMQRRCVAGVYDISQRRLDHWVPLARTLRNAIERLVKLARLLAP